MKEGRIFTVIFISVIIGVALFMASEIVRLNAEVERLIRDEKETVLATEHSNADSESEEENETASLGDFKITYYCPCNECSGIYGNQTSTGVFAEAGRTVAADPSIIPYGSVVVIEGKEYVVEDTGSALKGKRIIDIYVERHEDIPRIGAYVTEVFLAEAGES